VAQPGHDVCASDAKQFLVSVETIAVLDREHATKSGRLHHPKKKTAERKRQQIIEVGHMDGWNSEWRQPLWHLAQQFHAQPAEIHARSRDNPSNDDEQGYRFVLQKTFAQKQHRERTETEQERRHICFSEVRKEITGAFPKIAMRSFEPEKLRQLRAGYKQRDTALEPDEDTFRNEVDDYPCLGQPRDESQSADN